EEVIFHVRGYLCSANLPPITTERQVYSNIIRLTQDPRFAVQSIQLIGLDSPTFQNNLIASLKIHKLLQDAAGVPIQSWTSQNYRDCKALRFSNRYLTSPQHAQGEMPVPFGPEVDPLNILQGIADKYDLLHLDDNNVFYYEKQLSSNDKSIYQECSPSNILCGLAVEAQMSFVALPVKNSYKMIYKLHSICKYQQASVILKGVVFSPTRKMKRRVGYQVAEENEVAEVRDNLKRIRIDNESDESMSRS
ncbi:hypothetical protein K474DRAFT_1610082, partial [Panus rudis PR-1116 ss-1]